MPRNIEKAPASEEKKDHSAHAVRHTKPKYKQIKGALGSEGPQKSYNPDEIEGSDLTEQGVELAQEESEKFFDSLNPEIDALFFVSSKESRAIETANIYRQTAKAKGFEVIKPEHTRSKLAEKIGEGEIRAIEALSLNIKNPLMASIFTPDAQLAEINWKGVDDKTKKRWHEAHKMVIDKDKGSWGANYFYYSERIKDEFPEFESEFKTAQELYDKQFKNILDLVRFGIKKAEQSGIEKNVKIMGFGHENYFAIALDEYFDDHAIGNCEMINFKVSDDNNKITTEFKGKEVEL